jgi:hypothetical protein
MSNCQRRNGAYALISEDRITIGSFVATTLHCLPRGFFVSFVSFVRTKIACGRLWEDGYRTKSSMTRGQGAFASPRLRVNPKPPVQPVTGAAP